MMTTALKSSLRVLAWLYPLTIWLLHDHLDQKPLGFILLTLLTVDWVLSWPRSRLMWTICAVASLVLFMMTLAPEHVLRLYPLLMASSVLYIFIRSKSPDDNPMIGPMRRFIETDQELLLLLHKAKGLWIVGLSCNCLILFVLLFAFDNKTWALYASFYSYIWLLLLFLVTVIYVSLKKKRLL